MPQRGSTFPRFGPGESNFLHFFRILGSKIKIFPLAPLALAYVSFLIEVKARPKSVRSWVHRFGGFWKLHLFLCLATPSTSIGSPFCFKIHETLKISSLFLQISHLRHEKKNARSRVRPSFLGDLKAPLFPHFATLHVDTGKAQAFPRNTFKIFSLAHSALAHAFPLSLGDVCTRGICSRASVSKTTNFRERWRREKRKVWRF